MNKRNEMLVEIMEEIKALPVVQKYLYDGTWLSGSSTTVYPVTIAQDDVTLQWKSNDIRTFNKLMDIIREDYDYIFGEATFRRPYSCPASIEIKIKKDFDGTRKLTEKARKILEFKISSLMREAVSSEYDRYILEHEDEETGTTLMDDIIQNVLETSAWEDEGYYSESDIKFAIGRELMNRLKIFY